MKPKKRQKLCHHCEADVDLDVIVCPFCAADLREEKPEQQAVRAAAPAMKGLGVGEGSGLYPEARTIRGLPEETVVTEPVEETEKSPVSGVVLCTLGAQLLLLALMMLFFADGGKLTLQWSSKWWPLYLVGSLPLLFFGIKSLK